MTYPNRRMVITRRTSRIAASGLEAVCGQALVRIDHRGLIESTNAAIEICALVSNERMVHSVNAIACLRNSSRSSSLATSGLTTGSLPPSDTCCVAIVSPALRSITCASALRLYRPYSPTDARLPSIASGSATSFDAFLHVCALGGLSSCEHFPVQLPPTSGFWPNPGSRQVDRRAPPISRPGPLLCALWLES